MPNDYFHFKQFLVRQESCAMRVSTDACIQGALAAEFWRDKEFDHLLDIGTGTGLLSLMLAQELNATKFTAIDLDDSAFEQAKKNFEASPWPARLSALKIPLEDLAKTGEKFDAIICNPPFFHAHLKANNEQRNLARHDESLSKTGLASGIFNLLGVDGICCVMYPKTEWDAWAKVAQEIGLEPLKLYYIRPRKDQEVNRVIGFYGKTKVSSCDEQTLVIYQEDKKTYTSEFEKLLAPYYLKL